MGRASRWVSTAGARALRGVWTPVRAPVKRDEAGPKARLAGTAGCCDCYQERPAGQPPLVLLRTHLRVTTPPAAFWMLNVFVVFDVTVRVYVSSPVPVTARDAPAPLLSDSSMSWRFASD